MSAWRILICVYLALGVALSADAASSGVSNIRIVVSHVPTVQQQAAGAESVGLLADETCVRSGRHAQPHYIVGGEQPVAGQPDATALLVAGSMHCLDVASADSLAQAGVGAGERMIRIVPE